MATLSVIIPCFNAAGTLGRTLEALSRERARHAPIADIIVVDDASTDPSTAIARAGGARLIQLPRNGGDAAARNAGARAARGEILWFLDADVEPRPGIALRLAEFMDEHPEIDAAIGSYDATPSAPGFCSQFRNLMHHYVHQQAGDRVSTFWTGCGVVRRAAFERVGGFDDSFWPGASITDIHFGYQLTSGGGTIAVLRNVQVTHHKRWSLVSLMRTDIFQRALPWTILLRRYPALGRGELNLGARARVGVAAMGLGLAAVPFTPLLPSLGWLVLLSSLAVCWAHAPFLRFLSGRKGPAFAFGATGMLMVYDVCCGLGYILGNLCFRLRRRHLRTEPGQTGAG